MRLGRVPSTQTVAKALVESGPAEGTVVIAEAQTRGRGRGERMWHSPRGGLYMTAVLGPTRNASIIPLAAGVAVAESIRREVGLEAEVKWPNDVLVGGRKVGGILAESAWSGGDVRNILLGIGVNVNDRLPPALPGATSLSELGGVVGIDRFTDSLLERLGRRIELLEERPGDLIEAWRSMSSTLGRPVEVMSGSGDTVRGVALDVDGDGALLVETGQGVRRFVSGSLRERYC